MKSKVSESNNVFLKRGVEMKREREREKKSKTTIMFEKRRNQTIL
jgi:hypothetical protein